MSKIRKIAAQIPPLILWLLFGIFLWGFVFIHITDTVPENKITLCVDAQVPGDTALALKIEENAGGNIRMAKVRPFAYAMFDATALTEADLFIVPASHVEEYQAWFAPLPEEMRREAGSLLLDGEPWGLRVYDAATGAAAAGEYIDYAGSAAEGEDYYLFFGASSRHTEMLENAVDNEAVSAARLLLSLTGKD